MTVFPTSFSTIPVNTSEIPQVLLDIEDKQRRSPFPWKGQFSPQFIEVLIQTYAKQKDVLLDPFLGSGTVLFEAANFGVEAYGTELNPAAYTLSSVYRFANIRLEEREVHLSKFIKRLRANVLESTPLFRTEEKSQTTNVIKENIVNLALYSENSYLSLLHEAHLVLLDFHNKDVTSTRVFAVAQSLVSFVRQMPYLEQPIEAFNADARQIPLCSNSVDLVISSPPYINVFNYHQQYRSSTEALNWNLLQVAKSEFGSNRKHRGNRFLTVIQYCLDMSLTLEELLRLSKNGGHLILVLGRESNVRGTQFFNGELVAEVALKALGLPLELRQERKFTNRYGQTIKEDILHFYKKSERYTQIQDSARCVAVNALEASYSNAADGTKEGIKDAIERAEKVEPSPFYDRSSAKNEIILADAHV